MMKKEKKIAITAFILIALILIAFIVKIYIAGMYNEKGMNYYQKGEYSKAIEFYTKAVKWKKSNLTYHINLASAYIENNQIKKAKELIQRLLKKKPEEEKLLILSGRILISEKKYKEAIKVLTKSIEINPKIAVAYFHRGRALAFLENYKDALQDYKKAIKIHPEYVEAYWKSIEAREKLDDIEGAIKDYNVLEKLEPGNSKVYEGRGILKHDMENYKEALPDLLKAVEINDSLGPAWYYAGRCYAMQSEIPLAIKSFKKSAALNYKPVNAFYNIGFAYFNLRKADSAIYFFKESLKEGDSTDIAFKSYKYLGDVQLNTGRAGKAIQYFNKAIGLNPNYDAAYYDRGNAYFALKQFAKAEEDYKKCILLGMKTGDVYYNLGAVKINQYKYRESCPYLNKAIQLGNKNAEKLRNTYCR